MNRKAFTLIELLVVIAIIAVLMAILMPSLKVAREQARAIHCRSNERSLTMAWLMYKDDDDGKLVCGMPEWADRGAWMQIPPGAASSTVEQKKEYIRRGTLYPYTKNVAIYHCPSDRRQTSPWHQFAYATYSIAGGMNGVEQNGGWEIRPCIKYGDIKQPAEKLVFIAECDPRGYNNGSWVIQPKTKQWVDPFGIWHRDNSSTLSYADGHVEMHRWYSRGLIEWVQKALWEPNKFTFYRPPQDNEEMEDFEGILKAYAYRSLL